MAKPLGILARLSTTVLCLVLLSPLTAASAEAPRRHALSLLGEPKFGPDFKHFSWVNPNAPKGGRLRQIAIGSFDSLNPFTIKGNPAQGLGLIYDALMASSLDEPGTEYGLIAEWVSHPDDFSSATFGLRKEARFTDGKPITPEDVVFSLDALKKAHPQYALYYKNVVKAEKTGENEVTFTFDAKGNRELPQIVGELNVLPRHYWQAQGANGEPRDLSKSTLEVPVGSGPYRIKSVEAARSIVYERIKDYWAKDLPVMAGQYNFDEIEYTYFRDMTPAFEAFKSGGIDTWDESSANRWATQYGIDAVTKGWIKKEPIRHKRVAPMQAFALNLRRPVFAEPRVRRAFNLAFNFEELNKSLFYGQYIRVASYFDNSELKSGGLPQGRELEILNEVKADIPPEVFTTEWKNPLNAASTDFRQHMAEATRLLEAAGWTVREEAVDDPSCGFFCRLLTRIGLRGVMRERLLRNSAGEPMTVEFLIDQPDFERVVLPYIENLKLLGIKASARIVDSTQYRRRLDSFDFDVVVSTFRQSHSPGNEQRDFWGSAAAKEQGSRNILGIGNPAVDKLIDRIVFAKDRADLVAATRALDRVLLWNNYVVPQWHHPFDRVAYWDLFGRPEVLPSQSPGLQQTWWFDADKAKALAAARGR